MGSPPLGWKIVNERGVATICCLWPKLLLDLPNSSFTQSLAIKIQGRCKNNDHWQVVVPPSASDLLNEALPVDQFSQAELKRLTRMHQGRPARHLQSLTDASPMPYSPLNSTVQQFNHSFSIPFSSVLSVLRFILKPPSFSPISYS